jgi:hypothetical protein
MVKVLLKDAKYEGRYVAVRDFDETVVISDGSNFSEAYNKAVKKGVRNPVVFYVPVSGRVYIY